MADIATTAGTAGSGHSLSVTTALRLAWGVWAMLLIVPFLLFLCVVWTLMHYDHARVSPDRQAWFLAASGYLLVAVPASFFWRGHVFKAYWSGQIITPGKYLFGMVSVWLALVIGGIFSLLGCFVDQSLLPNLLPALVAFMFYVTLWPSGRAMVRSAGDSEDAGVYEPPR